MVRDLLQEGRVSMSGLPATAVSEQTLPTQLRAQALPAQAWELLHGLLHCNMEAGPSLAAGQGHGVVRDGW